MRVLMKIIPLILVIATLLSLVGCTEIQEAQGTNPGSGSGSGSGTGTGGGGGSTEQPELNDDPTDDFTVSLLVGGEPYSPRIDIDVYWSDGFSVHSAPVDENGVARVDGLDGDYRVTLSALPNELTYNPNENVATNDDRNIEVELYPVNYLVGGGGDSFGNTLNLTKTGVYSVKIEHPGDAVYLNYSPDASGTYTIESWVDIYADNVNPYVDHYLSNPHFESLVGTVTDGGPMGSYTINFVHTVEIAEEHISTGGQVSFIFAIKADSKTNQYPITVTFAVKRNGGFELDYAGKVKGTAIPTLDFSSFDVSLHEYGDGYVIVNPEIPVEGRANTYAFDDRIFKLWETKRGGDGFYHLFDEEKYPESGGYGPILYARITTPTRFIDRAFTNIEYENGDISGGELINGSISSVGGLNYKHFIEGYTQLATYGNINGGSYYCVGECPCHDAEKSTKDWACAEGCNECLPDCTGIPEALIGNEGYQSIANSDGMVPVTEELRVFLQAFCEKMQYFWDGQGFVDKAPIDGIHYQAVGDSGWLFACAYYEKAE